MKKITAAILALLLSAAASPAKDRIGFEWDPSPSEEWVNGYRIYQRVDSPPPVAVSWKIVGDTLSRDITKWTNPDALNGTTVFVVVAYNLSMESPHSNELSYSLLTAPKGLRVTSVTFRINP